ncbi:putative receptor-like protein kinase At1g80870 [Impatiens glandulifera]|uniref:putative receptor-like protein kinase At1g80870 n=1 Tax=Impatiens glandulifera TaxID=253017 RepID=UPI001FB19346|nr:putative receptor-like protein kinase At1g80870 [Impatiens glandulifera]
MTSREPSPHSPSPTHKYQSTILLIAITILSSIVLLFAILYFLYHLWYSLVRVRKSRTSPFEDSIDPLMKLRKFNFKEMRLATNDFGDDNSIGKGGSGTVFRGILRDGKLVAVKMLDSSSEQTFQNELQILGTLKSPFIVSLIGYCSEKDKRLLVYEYMPNRSLQEYLFSDSNWYLDWEKRFEIILDVSKALVYLHLECDPPVVHGDVKPSNVLLDSDYRPKISDFGLSRLKNEAEFGVDLFSQELSCNLTGTGAETPVIGTPVDRESEVDFSLALQASTSSKNSKVIHNLNGLNLNLNSFSEKGKEVSTVENCNEDDADSVNGGRRKDWWWRQDDVNAAELSSNDYVMEWIGSQIWEEDNRSPSEIIDHKSDKSKPENLNQTTNKKHRKMLEWWKEEHLDEIKKKANKSKKRFRISRLDLLKFRKRRKPCQPSQTAGEFSFRGDLFSRELSSTTSMRGTLCYVAPEYSGCGYLMEKSDIYSLGVLILVIISGRRPLHVLSSPMKLEKANLISWCRQLSQAGNVLELVDERLKEDYDKDQASLCINVALACLQKMPELRPDIGEIVKILSGEMDLPSRPFEFSPSPPARMVNRSRRKHKTTNIE